MGGSGKAVSLSIRKKSSSTVGPEAAMGRRQHQHTVLGIQNEIDGCTYKP